MKKTLTIFLPEYSPLLLEFPETGKTTIQQTIKRVMVFLISFKYVIFKRSDALRFIDIQGLFNNFDHKSSINLE